MEIEKAIQPLLRKGWVAQSVDDKRAVLINETRFNWWKLLLPFTFLFTGKQSCIVTLDADGRPRYNGKRRRPWWFPLPAPWWWSKA